MNLHEAKAHFKTAYTVKDVSKNLNYGKAIIFLDTIKETTMVIHCRSTKGTIILYDKQSKATADIIQHRGDKKSIGDRAIKLLKEIVAFSDNPETMDCKLDESILIQGREIAGLCR